MQALTKATEIESTWDESFANESFHIDRRTELTVQARIISCLPADLLPEAIEGLLSVYAPAWVAEYQGRGDSVTFDYIRYYVGQSEPLFDFKRVHEELLKIEPGWTMVSDRLLISPDESQIHLSDVVWLTEEHRLQEAIDVSSQHPGFMRNLWRNGLMVAGLAAAAAAGWFAGALSAAA